VPEGALERYLTHFHGAARTVNTAASAATTLALASGFHLSIGDLLKTLAGGLVTTERGCAHHVGTQGGQQWAD